MAEAVLEREPAASRDLYGSDLGLPADEAVRWVAAICGLHDLGKASPVFQALWKEGRERTAGTGFRWTARSEGLRVPHNWITEKTLRGQLVTCGWQQAAARCAARAVGAHHGFPSEFVELSSVTPGVLGTHEEWGHARSMLVNFIRREIGAGPPPPVEVLSAAAFMRLAGLTSLADWIASDRDLFPYVPRPFAEAKTLAERALDRIGWGHRRPVTTLGVSFATLFGRSPRPVQQCVADLVGGLQAPCLVVVEAPMGEGKTEAALYAHALLESAGHRGLYIAMPTQATGNAMFDRVRDFLGSRGASEAVDLQLVHGSAFLHQGYRELRASDVGRDGRDGIGEGAVVASGWFSRLRRALLSGYGVGTVDQALLGVLRVRHQFVRLWGLGNRTVVLDEVHAYELYTSRLIDRLISWLRSLGSSVIILSATLPRHRREELYRAFGRRGSVPEVPYPRVSVVDANDARAVSVAPRRSQRLHLAAAPFPAAALADRLWELALPGGCVAAVVNTVGRAQEVYSAVRRRYVGEPVPGGLDLTLVHARMPAEDRERREAALLARYGPKGARPFRSIVIVDFRAF